MKAKRFGTMIAGLLLTVGLSACDWSSGGGAESWNDSFNWVNFSGVYRGAGGNPVVSEFGGDGGNIQVNNEVVATGDGSRTAFAGSLNNRPVVAGSVSITAAGFTLSDQGDGTLAGGGKTGSISYETGSWSITLTPAAPDAGSAVVASYSYAAAGAAGLVATLSVQQRGERITITDSAGASYAGVISNIRGVSGGGENAAPVVGDVIVGQYNASGVSRSGREVRMTGSFETTVTGTAEAPAFSGRRMNGTWVEAGAGTGNINGSAGDMQVDTSLVATP